MYVLCFCLKNLVLDLYIYLHALTCVSVQQVGNFKLLLLLLIIENEELKERWGQYWRKNVRRGRRRSLFKGRNRRDHRPADLRIRINQRSNNFDNKTLTLKNDQFATLISQLFPDSQVKVQLISPPPISLFIIHYSSISIYKYSSNFYLISTIIFIFIYKYYYYYYIMLPIKNKKMVPTKNSLISPPPLNLDFNTSRH